jgi:outer membrane protein assembly factor BamB
MVPRAFERFTGVVALNAWSRGHEMDRRRGLSLTIGLVLALACLPAPAQAFIEKLTNLGDVISQSDLIFLAKVESVDPAKPSTVLTFQQDLKGKSDVRRMPINLTGDKEKHTPQLLKRLAPGLPVVVFLTDLPDSNKKQVLVFSNGCWFQVLGHPDGQATRWAFTHIEIYLRRTFAGTTAEMQQLVTDALAGKKKPPPANPKEPPGFGPEVESRPKPQGSRGHGVLMGVIALPFLMPIAALFHLLFPGILRDQVRQYRIAVSVLLSESTLIFAHWAICRWGVDDPSRHWWLSPAALTGALVAVALLGVLIAVVIRIGHQGPLLITKPYLVEYFALGALLTAGLGWSLYLWLNATPPFGDHMTMVTAAAALALLHLVLRRWRSAAGGEHRALVTTEIVFLASLAVTGAALGIYWHQPDPANLEAGAVTGEWTAARGNERRTGAADPGDSGPSNPAILWTFDPAERKGRVYFHSSPTVVDGQVYIGAMHEVLAFTQGLVYCVNAVDGRQVGEAAIPVGQRLWRFHAGGSLKPVFSSPIVHGGRIYFGEGYHQDSQCRLFSLDARSGDRSLWSKRTASHVESSPCIVGSRVFFGAGDDGLYCVDSSIIEQGPEGPEPKVVWQLPGIHVDASPVVVEDRVFAGSIVGDRHQTLLALAVDARSGQVLWRTPAPIPVTGSPSVANGRVFYGLGNGKFNQNADQPTGALWCLDCATGRRLWEYPVGNSIFGSPALTEGSVFFGCNDGHAYCLKQEDGSLVWKANTGSAVTASVVVAGGKVYALNIAGTLTAFDAASGKELWRLTNIAGDDVTDAYSSPTLVAGRLYLAIAGRVYCIGDRPQAE